MKNLKHCVFIGGMAIAVFAFSFIGCYNGNNSNPAPEIIRVFTITADGKTITIKDMRTGAKDKNLQELGIVGLLETGFDGARTHTSFNTVVGRTGFVIEVENTSEYTYYKAYSATRLAFNLSFLSNPGVYLGSSIGAALTTMENGPYPQQI